MTNRTQDIAQDLLRLSAQKLWAERANPVSMPTGTWNDRSGSSQLAAEDDPLIPSQAKCWLNEMI